MVAVYSILSVNIKVNWKIVKSDFFLGPKSFDYM